MISQSPLLLFLFHFLHVFFNLQTLLKQCRPEEPQALFIKQESLPQTRDAGKFKPDTRCRYLVFLNLPIWYLQKIHFPRGKLVSSEKLNFLLKFYSVAGIRYGSRNSTYLFAHWAHGNFLLFVFCHQKASKFLKSIEFLLID